MVTLFVDFPVIFGINILSIIKLRSFAFEFSEKFIIKLTIVYTVYDVRS